MSDGVSKENTSSDSGLVLTIFIIILGFSAILALALISYFLFYRADLWDAESAARMGQRGDFFGGFLNPILTTLTFAAFLVTVLMQRAELRNSRRQFETSALEMRAQTATARAQSYQTGFFQLLTMYDNIANAMSIIDPTTKKTVVGREAFRVMYSNMRRVYREKRKRFPKSDENRVILLAFETIFKQEHHQLPHYFRFLYNAIKMLEGGPESDRYIKIMRAAISNQELLILFYNCGISPHGSKFREVAERHAIFDNMSPRLLEAFHASLVDEKAFGPGGYESIRRRAHPQIRGDLSVAQGVEE